MKMALKKITNLIKTPNELSFLFLRVIIGCMWISQGFIKLIDRTPDALNDHHFFLKQLHDMADTNPIPAVSSILNNILIPNYQLLTWIVIFLEIGLGISMIFGIFSRIGSLVGIGFTLVLFINTLGWGEWLWTYPLIATPMVVIFIASFQNRFGFDNYIHQKFSDNKLVDLLI